MRRLLHLNSQWCRHLGIHLCQKGHCRSIKAVGQQWHSELHRVMSSSLHRGEPGGTCHIHLQTLSLVMVGMKDYSFLWDILPAKLLFKKQKTAKHICTWSQEGGLRTGLCHVSLQSTGGSQALADPFSVPGKFSRKGVKLNPAALYPLFARHVVKRNALYLIQARFFSRLMMCLFTSLSAFPRASNRGATTGRDGRGQGSLTAHRLLPQTWEENCDINLQPMVVGSPVMRVDHRAVSVFPREGNPAWLSLS